MKARFALVIIFLSIAVLACIGASFYKKKAFQVEPSISQVKPAIDNVAATKVEADSDEVVSDSSGKALPGEAESYAEDSLPSVLEDKIRNAQDVNSMYVLLCKASATFGPEKALSIIESKLQSVQKDAAESLVPCYVKVILENQNVDGEKFSSMIDRVSALQNEEAKRESFDFVYAALENLALSDSKLKALAPLIKQNEPPTDDGMVYMEWLAAYSIAATTSKLASDRGPFIFKTIQASNTDAKVNALAYGQEYLNELPEQQLISLLPEIDAAMQRLPAGSEKAILYREAIAVIKGRWD